MKKLVTTLGEIRAQYGMPLDTGPWRQVLIDLGENRFFNKSREVSLKFILNEYGLDDALWLTRCFPELATPIVLYALWCAERVRHLMTDKRSTNALDLARRYLTRRNKEPLLTEKEISKLKEYTRAALKVAAEHAKEAAKKAKKEASLFPTFGDVTPEAADAARSAWLVSISASASCDEWDHVCDVSYVYYHPCEASHVYYVEGLYTFGKTLYDAVYSAVRAASNSVFNVLTEEESAREKKAQTEEFLRMIDCIENGIEYSI